MLMAPLLDFWLGLVVENTALHVMSRTMVTIVITNTAAAITPAMTTCRGLTVARSRSREELLRIPMKADNTAVTACSGELRGFRSSVPGSDGIVIPQLAPGDLPPGNSKKVYDKVITETSLGS
jgi:hypothetical protein